MNKTKLRNRIGLPLIYLLSWTILYCIPRKYLFGGENEIRGWILGITIFFFLPFFLYRILRINKISYEISKIVAYGSVFLFFPYYLGVMIEAKTELKLHRKEVIGIINKSWTVKRRKNRSVWSVQAKYVIDGKIYTTSMKEDKNRILIRGDSVTVIYSAITPEISEIKELMEHYKN